MSGDDCMEVWLFVSMLTVCLNPPFAFKSTEMELCREVSTAGRDGCVFDGLLLSFLERALRSSHSRKNWLGQELLDPYFYSSPS